MLNQPQVAGKRIWIESRRALLPAAAAADAAAAGAGCIHGHWHQWDRIRKIDGKGESPLSPLLFLSLT